MWQHESARFEYMIHFNTHRRRLSKPTHPSKSRIDGRKAQSTRLRAMQGQMGACLEVLGANHSQSKIKEREGEEKDYRPFNSEDSPLMQLVWTQLSILPYRMFDT